MKLDRRTLLGSLAATGLTAALPNVAFAKTGGSNRFVLIILRGGMDGLAAVPPLGDPNYLTHRRDLTSPMPGQKDGIVKLDGFYGLHPALAPLLPMWKGKELAVVHAVGLKGKNRSHFDSQDMLETGASGARTVHDGWLNRALSAMQSKGEANEESNAIAIAQAMPLVLTGAAPVGSWSPPVLPQADDETLARLKRIYAGDEALAMALEQGLATREMAEQAEGMKAKGPARALATQAATMGAFLAAEEGPRIAVAETYGWDTHARQGRETGVLANRLKDLSEGLVILKEQLGEAWKKTAVVAVTEFGRTVAVNGTGGTDHGAASAAFVLGGAVKGGQVISDWPGLGMDDLYEGRDLKTTIDINAVFKTLLTSHLNLPLDKVNETVLPETATLQILPSLLR